MVYYISLVIVLIPFVIALLSIKTFDVALKIFFAFVAYGVLNESLALILVEMVKVQNTMPLAHFYGLVTFLIISILYKKLLHGYINKKWINVLVVLYTVYYLINSLFVQSFFEYPGTATAIGTIIILLYIVLYFSKFMQEAKIRNPFNDPLVWISGALLIFYSVNLFFFVLFNLLLDFSPEFTRLVIYSRIGFNVLVYLMITIGFLKQRMAAQNA